MAKQFEAGYALLIAVDKNYVPGWALPDVANDVRALDDVLTHPERCAYREGNVKIIVGQDATRLGILDGLEWLQDRIQTNTSGSATAVIYYTGHGWRDDSAGPPTFYLVPYDVREEKIRSRALRAEDFAAAMVDLQPQRLLIVLDCCHAAGMGVKEMVPLPAGYVNAAAIPSLYMKGEEAAVGPGAKGLEMLVQGRGRAVLSSSTGEQSSYIRKDRKMSIFTYHLIEAITGHAQPQEGATEVLVSDLMGYVWRHVPQSAIADWGKAQEPDFQVSGNFPIAPLLGGKGLSKGQTPPDPLEPIGSEDMARAAYHVDTGGGDYTGRDKVAGDKITVGNIVGSTGVAIGRGAQAAVTQGVGGEELATLFATVYKRIQARPEDPHVDKEELTETIQKIEGEVNKGDDANPKKVERWLRMLGLMASDIFDVTLACLTSPVAAIATVVRKVAEKARAEAGQADQRR